MWVIGETFIERINLQLKIIAVKAFKRLVFDVIFFY